MAKRDSKTCGVYQYLEASGVLDTGSSTDIAQKRKEYWNMRKRASKQEKLKKETEFKVYFSDTELAAITKAAKVCGISRTKYIHEAALANAGKTVPVQDKAAMNHIIQLLALNYAVLQEIAEAATVPVIESLVTQLADLERQVLTAIHAPQTSKPET